MAKRKHEIEVTLRAETAVRIAVWADDDEDPAHLTLEEARIAINLADPFPRWEVEKAKEVLP